MIRPPQPKRVSYAAPPAAPSRLPRGKALALLAGGLFSVAGVTAFGVAPLTASDLPPVSAVTDTVTLSPVVYESNLGRYTQHEAVRRGETLSSLLARLGAEDTEFAAFVRRDPVARGLLELRAGRSVSAALDEDKRILRLTYRLGGEDAEAVGRRLTIARNGDRFSAYQEAVPVERAVEYRSAEIGRSLIEALDAADIPDNVLTKMADVFGSDLNLGRDLRRGDRLRVVYETVREAGSVEPPVVGKILAVQFRGASRNFDAVWFDRSDGTGGYYTFDGRNLARPFLASPLAFTRVSSGFSGERHHPVHGDWRAHRGVDMPAPIGTPIRTVAAGVVEAVEFKQNGYGRMVRIKHGPRYTTVYAHLHNFAEGLNPGDEVKQGEIIGTVGNSGTATGSHLHFEFHVDGRYVDPMAAMSQVPARALAPEERAQFADLSGRYRTRFGVLDTQVAARFE